MAKRYSDKERLDWLEMNGANIAGYRKHMFEVWIKNDWVKVRGIRKAIDTIIEAERKSCRRK